MGTVDRVALLDSEALRAPRLLVVDDDEYFLRTVQELWGSQNRSIETATSVGSALRLCIGREFDLLLLDLRLPDGSGIDVLREVRSHGSTAGAIVLTGYADVESTVQAMKLGATDVLEKPIDPDSLIFAIEKSLSAGSFGGPTLAPPMTAEEELLGLIKAAIAISSSAAEQKARSHAVFTLLLRPFASGFSRNILVFVAVTDTLRNLVSCRTRIESCQDALIAIDQYARDRLAELSDDPNGIGGSFLRQMADADAVGLGRSEEYWGRSFGMHPSHFGRQLQRLTGLSFLEWRRSFRLRRALQLLHRTDEQCAQVAFSCGYEHPSQFNHDFRRVFGIAPTEFRTWLGRRAAARLREK